MEMDDYGWFDGLDGGIWWNRGRIVESSQNIIENQPKTPGSQDICLRLTQTHDLVLYFAILYGRSTGVLATVASS